HRRAVAPGCQAHRHAHFARQGVAGDSRRRSHGSPIMNLQYSGEETIPVDKATVWAFINDPEKVGRCLPDVVDVTVHDPTHFDAIAQVGVGPVRGKFKFKFELQPSAAGDRMDMKITGGGFGSAIDLTAGADL